MVLLLTQANDVAMGIVGSVIRLRAKSGVEGVLLIPRRDVMHALFLACAARK